jgi:iron complex outermembrane receptor protein
LSRFDGLGSFRWGFDANFNHTKFNRIESPPPALAAAGLVLIDHQRQGDFTLGTPSNKLIWDVDWTLGNVETFLRATRYGPVTAVNDNPALNAEAGSKLIVDLNVSYHFTDHFNSTIGADNVFNTHPTIVIAADQANGAQYYNAYSPFGISGGFYYARLSYKF